MKKYKARVSKHILDSHEGYTCLYGISIGNPNQSDEKLKATIDFINDNFSECIIGLSDTLQIPNHIANGLTREEAREKSIINRNMWIDRNEHIIKKLKIKYTIQLWDETMSLPCKHGDLFDLFNKMYEKDLRFKCVIDSDVKQFVDRNPSLIGKEYLSREFLFTELDGYSRVGQTGKYIKIYPSSPLKSFSTIQDGKFDWAMYGMNNIRSSRIYFDRVAQNNNQSCYKHKIAL
ncbi:hypothetical protein [Flavivirga jejuensis]|uniref:Cyclodipeptide synthase n=1 Tax=Flavivirga jejuensis TaxID=870487 RepID=A0ABT8WR24_9FLAO|nr:hypothetical protein [Flavivirga jejuensis]MDO5975601.1 hypothetical protein [Flavivirga jejuensis]